MEYYEKITQLIENGFDWDDTREILIKDLPKESDRFSTVLYVYVDDLDHVYINQYKTSGLRTISDGELLTNHNECSTYAKSAYLKTIDALPFLSSALTDTEPSDTIKTGKVHTVPFTVDPLFITMELLRQNYDKLVKKSTTLQSTILALYDVLYENPLTDDELTGLWKKWKQTYDHENETDTINISGEQSQIDQLFDTLCQIERYETERKTHYLTGMDYAYAVIDLKAEEVMQSEFGSHYMTIIQLINKNHKDTFYTWTHEEKDAFILSNFELIGAKYEDNKKYYVHSVNESIHWCTPERTNE